MKSVVILVGLFMSLYNGGHCQSLDSLSGFIKDIQRGANNDIRFTANEKFATLFEKLLLEHGSFSRNFDSLKNVSVLLSDDNFFRIYTWTVPDYDGSFYKYFGFIQLRQDSLITLIRLNDSTDVIRKPESEKLTAERWLGAAYYAIIPIKKSGKTFYTLLGWKGKNQSETQKVIEVLSIVKNQIKFGSPIFKTGSVFHNRMLYTYNAHATMTLHYDKNYKGIVLDHLATDKNNPSVISGPDGTYDAFKYKKTKWILYRDVDVRSNREPNDVLPVPPVEEK